MTSIEQYKNAIPSVKNILQNNRLLPIEECCALIAATTWIPIIDVCYIVQELENISLEDKILRLKKFYKIV